MGKNSKKNKRGGAMSGGKGKVSRYTQKFKQSYNRFMKIGDNDDDNSKLKKMEEWGRMRGIYKFLKFQNHKYTGDNGEEKTALEKMEENINKTLNNTGYKNAISCFQQNENDILSGEGESSKCIPEEDYIKGAGGMETTADESSPPIVENNEAPIEVPTEEEPTTPIEEPATTEYAPVPNTYLLTRVNPISTTNMLLPAESKARPLGPRKIASIELTTALPPPTGVLMIRTRLLLLSETYKVPLALATISTGLLNKASVPLPLAKPETPQFPARVLT